MKSDELQGLRGIAVIAVVLFHLKIDYVARGFLGVDVFFVLSGYFMARALSKKRIDREKAIKFYKRRVKRLLPCFALLLFLVTFTMPWFLILDEVDTAAIEISLSLPFLINLKFASDQQNYWTKDKDFSSVVMHLWSLALEMQFYLCVPLIFRFVNRLDKPAHRLAAHSSLFAVSLLSHAFDPSESCQFYLLHNRLWEFLAGFVVQELEDKAQQTKYSTLAAPASLILTWLLSGTHKPDARSTLLALRFATICCTSVVVLFSKSGTNRILSTRWLVYVGDISYVLYLVHWPVIVLVHTWVLSTLETSGVISSLAISLALSILVHHVFEKPLITQKFNECFSISMVFYAVVCAALVFRVPQNLSGQIIRTRQGHNSTLYDLMQWNFREASHCCNTLPMDCTRDYEVESWMGWNHPSTGRCLAHGNGTLRVLVAGNSVSMSSFATVHRALAGRYSSLRLFSEHGCWLLFGTCEDFWRQVKAVVEKMRPDIILITESQRLMNDRPNDNDVMVHAQERIDYLRTHSKAVMVDTQYMIPDYAHSYNMAQYLARGWTNMSTFNLPLETQLSLKRVAYDRITSLKGENIVINNITFAFCERVKGVCEGHNPLTLKAYTQTGAHVNSYGYEVLASRYRHSIDRVMKIASLV